jgi:hypothetical protein
MTTCAVDLSGARFNVAKVERVEAPLSEAEQERSVEWTPSRFCLYSAVTREFGVLVRSRLIDEMRNGRWGGFERGV